MDWQKYRDTVESNLLNADYEEIDDVDHNFDFVYTKKKMAGYVDNGYERRFIALTYADTVSIGSINDAVTQLQEVVDDSTTVGHVGTKRAALASTPKFVVIATDSLADTDIRDHVEDSEFMTGSSFTAPVIAELEEGGGLRGPDVKLSHTLPKRRNLPKRQAVKRLISKGLEP